MLSASALTGRRPLAGLVLVAVGMVLAVVVVGRSEAQPTGGYLDFSGPGAGWVEVAHDSALTPQDEITVEAWVFLRSYTNGFGPDTEGPFIVGKNWVDSYALAFSLGNADLLDAYVNGTLVEGPLTVPLNQWAHVAMTYDGAMLRTYLNGQLNGSAPLTGPINSTGDPLQIGNDVQWDRTPDGSIDDVRIWRIARTQAQIQSGMDGV